MLYTPTTVTFTQSVWEVASTVQLTQSMADKLCVVTHTSPFHPVSHIWPDHPADRGTLTSPSGRYSVEDCLIGAIGLEQGALYVGQQIPVKRDTDGWVFVVVHVISADPGVLSPGEQVTLTVDRAYQQSLSRGHSAGHLAFLALNKVLADGYWRKDADRKDPHGYWDFNSYAQVSSLITENRCVDIYRLGKTLRKRGLNNDDVLRDLALIEGKVNEQLQHWLNLGSTIEMRREGETLTDSRYWQCDLAECHTAVIPCGGTHATSLRELAAIQVTLQSPDEQHIRMQTELTVDLAR